MQVKVDQSMLANGGELNGKRLAPSTVKLMK